MTEWCFKEVEVASLNLSIANFLRRDAQRRASEAKGLLPICEPWHLIRGRRGGQAILRLQVRIYQAPTFCGETLSVESAKQRGSSQLLEGGGGGADAKLLPRMLSGAQPVMEQKSADTCISRVPSPSL